MEVLAKLKRIDEQMEVAYKRQRQNYAMVSVSLQMFRQPSFYRIRWQQDYLLNLANNEGSFVSEYRVDPVGFDMLIHYLQPQLEVSSRYNNVYHFLFFILMN